MSKSIFAGLVSLYTILLFGLFTPAFADYSVPVSHTHNGREHNHQLPKEGLNHRHGISQAGRAIQKQNKVIYSNTTIVPNTPRNTSSNQPRSTYKPPKPSNPRIVQNDPGLHSHAGREHQHPLPNQGVFHRHGTNGAIGQRVINNTSTTVVYDDIQNAPNYNSSNPNRNNNANTRSNGSINNGYVNDNYTIRDNRGDDNVSRNRKKQNRSERRRWRQAQGVDRFIKGSTQCDPNKTDCNVCAVNVKQQFQKAASKQINWSRKSWNFTWPQPYPPQNVRPLDVFDGDPKYALGIPDKHVQGFVRTNSRLFPYAGSHSHKRKGGIFVVKQGANGEQSLSSLHQTTGKHPSGVQVIGKYLVYGEGTRLFFRDINSQNQRSGVRLTAAGANFGGGLGIIKLARDNHLLITTGPGGQRPNPRFNRFYHLKSVNGRPSSLSFINKSSTNKPQQWPTILSYSENMSLITECGTGDVYSIHTTGDEKGVSAISGKGYWRLSKLVTNGKALGLTAVNAFTTRQDIKRCNVRAAATVNVNPQNRLEFVCHGYAKDPDGSGFNILGKSSRNRDKFYYNVGVVR